MDIAVCLECGKESPTNQRFCECGYDFGTSSSSQNKGRPVKGKKKDSGWGAMWFILISLLGIVVLLFAASSLPSTVREAPLIQGEDPTDTPELPNPTYAPTQTIQPTSTVYYPPITWMQLNQFLSDDHTSWNEYDVVDYACINYSQDLVKNARKKNIDAWIIAVTFENDTGPGHAFVAFPTSDLGVVYIEPQGDNRYIGLKVGNWLCDAWGMYQCMGVVKTVERLNCIIDAYCEASPYQP